jgi:hypothetical protein
MSWTMPHRVLQIVALLLILSCATAFAVGVAGQLSRGGHLPGERILSGVTGAAPVEAQDAVPLSEERIEGPPPPTEEEKAKAKKEAEEEAARAAAEEAAAAAAPVGNAAAPAPPVIQLPVGNAAEIPPPPPDEPPH